MHHEEHSFLGLDTRYNYTEDRGQAAVKLRVYLIFWFLSGCTARQI
jgi:hypothetical protein